MSYLNKPLNDDWYLRKNKHTIGQRIDILGDKPWMFKRVTKITTKNVFELKIKKVAMQQTTILVLTMCRPIAKIKITNIQGYYPN